MNPDIGKAATSSNMMADTLMYQDTDFGNVRASTSVLDRHNMDMMGDLEEGNWEMHHQQKTMSIIMPDGKKVKRVKTEDDIECFVPTSLSIPERDHPEESGAADTTKPVLDHVCSMDAFHYDDSFDYEDQTTVPMGGRRHEERQPAFSIPETEEVLEQVAGALEAERMEQEALRLEQEAERLAEEAEAERLEQEAERLAEEAEAMRLDRVAEAQRKIKEDAKRKAEEEWNARIMEELKKAQSGASSSSEDDLSVQSVQSDVAITTERRNEAFSTDTACRRHSAPIFNTSKVAVGRPRSNSEDSHYSNDSSYSDDLEQQERDICDELREEIRKVKFPKKSKKHVTIIMPDGKKVKQVKKEDEALVPMSLTLECKGKKGDIFVREDGKRVRLVKKKEKKRREKLKKKKEKEEVKRLRKEADRKARQEEIAHARAMERARTRERLMMRDWGEMSWQEAEEEQERIMAWQEAEEEEERMRNEEAEDMFYAHNEDVERTYYPEDEETGSDSDRPTSEGSEEFQSDNEGGSDNDVSLQADELVVEKPQKDLEVSTSTLATAPDSDDDEFNGFLESIDEQRKKRLSYVERMALESKKALEKANEMKRLMYLASSLGNLQAQRLRFVAKMDEETRVFSYARSPNMEPRKKRAPAFSRCSTL